jgi:hypothetical protein
MAGKSPQNRKIKYEIWLGCTYNVMPVCTAIHDGRLRACPSCLLGLMYVYKVNVRS